MISKDTFSKWAKELGFAKIGFCLPERFERSQKIVDSQEPLSERKQLRFFPSEDYPEASCIAVLLWPYLPAKECGKDEVFIDRYYESSNAAYHAAQKLEARIQDAGCFVKANVAYPAKEAAIRAGMGVIGRNSLLITPEYGSRVVIILMATDIKIQISDTDGSAFEECLTCGRCSQACPTGAITQQGMIHPERCLRNYMMEGVVVPEHLREKMGMRLIGCDICQRVCPMQPRIEECSRTSLSLDRLVTEDSVEFSASVSLLANEIGRNTARPQRVRAQAALLAGNSGNPAYIPILQQWAQMPFDAVREHSLWAISKITSKSQALDRHI